MARYATRWYLLLVSGVLGCGCVSQRAVPTSNLTPGANQFGDSEAAVQPSRSLVGELAVRTNAFRPLEKTRALLTQALGRDEEDSGTGQLSLARLAERRGMDQEARKLYLALIDKEQERAVAYHRLGVIAARQRRFQEAREYFDQAVHFGSETADLLSDIGYAYYLENRLDEAEKHLLRALEIQPGHTAANNNLGLVFADQGRLPESLAAFKRAVAEGEAYANFAYALAQNGAFDHALANYSHALTLDDKLRRAAKAMLQVAERRTTLPATSPESAEMGETQLARTSERPDDPVSPDTGNDVELTSFGYAPEDPQEPEPDPEPDPEISVQLAHHLNNTGPADRLGTNQKADPADAADAADPADAADAAGPAEAHLAPTLRRLPPVAEEIPAGRDGL